MNGIVYVAWGEEHIAEAQRSAASVASEWPTCLITNEAGKDATGFDSVIVTDFALYEGYHCFFRKLSCFELSPFRNSLYLDSDTVVMGNLDLVFESIERFGLAVTIAPGQTFHSNGKEFIHYNGGLIGFNEQNRNLGCKILLKTDWLEPSHIGDEAAISVTIQHWKISHATLPSVFNLHRAGPVNDRSIRVFHSRYECSDLVLKSDRFGNDESLRLSKASGATLRR